MEQELKTEASELISAAINPPATKPFIPTGSSVVTSIGKALSALSIPFESITLNISGFCRVKAYAIIPGIKKIRIGNNLRYAPNIAPLLPIIMLFAANVL